MLYTLRFFSSKCSLFHNANVFGSCIIHILYKGCAEIKKKNNSGSKGLITHTNTCIYIYIYYLRSLKCTLKHLKNSYIFRSYDHPQGAYIFPC